MRQRRMQGVTTFVTVLGFLVTVLAVMVQVGWGEQANSNWPCSPSTGEYEGLNLFPVAILSMNSFTQECSTWAAIGVGSTTTVSNNFPQAYSVPFAVASSNLAVRTVDPSRQIIYSIFFDNHLGIPNQLMGFQLMQTSYPDSPVLLRGGIYSIQNYFLYDPTISHIAFHPAQGLVYFLGRGYIDLAIGYFNTSASHAQVIYESPVADSYSSPTAAALDTAKDYYAFAVTTGTTGISYVYSLLTSKIVSSTHFNSASSYWNCTEWTFDPASGNIYGVYSNPQGGIDFGIVDPFTATVSNIATLYKGPASVVRSTLTVDYQLGKGYVMYQLPISRFQGTKFALLQFDPTSGEVFSTTITTQSYPVWAIYAPWLSTSYY